MNKTNIRQLKRNLHGVSVVIGALMLTLIVVTAAASFAIFTAQKQEELQEQEWQQLIREQEQLDVVKIADIAYENQNLLTLSFSIASQHTCNSKIVVLKINDHIISDFNITDQTNQQMQGWTLKGRYFRTAYFANDTEGNLYVFDDLNGNHKADSGEEILDNNPDGGDEATPEAGNQGYLYAKDSDGEPYLFNDTDFDGYYNSSENWYNSSNEFSLDPDGNDRNAVPADGDRGNIYPEFDSFTIDSLGQYIISIDNAADDIIYFGELLKQNDALTIEMQTQLTNTFEKSFIPPTANIKVKEEDDSIILDGTSSFSHNYSNIVKWEWELTNTLTGKTLPLKNGRKVNANRILVDDGGITDYLNSEVNWIINLTVTDDFGMKGIANFSHIQDFKPIMTENEDLEIVDFRVNYSNQKIDYVNFSIKSNYEFDSNITELFINNIHCMGNFTPYMSVKNYSMNINSDLDNVTFAVLDQIDLEKPVTIKFKTAFGNTFERTFYPPNAVIRIQIESLPTGGDDYYILDGSLSDHPGDGYIVSWKWNVTNTSDSTITKSDYLEPDPVGRKAMISNSSFINATEDYEYRVNLTVIDNFNMIGKSSFIFKP